MTTETKKKPKVTTLGYPHIEQLLETENFETVNKSFAEAYDKLEAIMKDRSAGLKKQKDAQKSMQAYELTVELINELLKIKREIAKQREKGGQNPKKNQEKSNPRGRETR